MYTYLFLFFRVLGQKGFVGLLIPKKVCLRVD